ncbi:metal ABC transporter solute-binding protein, Zn/Mn family [Arcobacter vandammei]|uniref:metal ABC transporter solute-binding protein, Zn/Mn family n=1 Tax=Arcobacter vandammei TaxID=2782243 RepID=UPI0018E048F9
MKKLIFILIFPIFLFAKIQVTTYFPLESAIIKKIVKQEAEITEISHRFINKYIEIPTSELKKLSNSKFFLHFGLDIENKYADILKQNNKKLEIVDLSKNIDKISSNPYIWTDPFAIKDIAKNVFDLFSKIDTRNHSFYKKNYESFLNEIDETFLFILQNLNKSDINSFYAIEDYWDYFANRFRLEVIKKDKKVFTTLELKNLNKTYENSEATKLLYCYSYDEKFANILATNLKVQAIENNIFNEDWHTNLINLTNSIIK